MSGLTEEINSREEAENFARSNPPEKVLGLLIWNMMLMQRRHEKQIKAYRAKNAFLQTVGGAVGGAATAWGIWIVGKAYILGCVKDQAIEYIKTYMMGK